MGTYSKGYGKNFRIVYTVEMEPAPRERDGGMDGAALMVAAVSFYHSFKLILPE